MIPGPATIQNQLLLIYYLADKLNRVCPSAGLRESEGFAFRGKHLIIKG